MTDLLEILHSYLTDGITVSTLLAVYLTWRKIQEAKQKKAAHERMEKKQQAIMNHLGVPWDWDAEKKYSSQSMGESLSGDLRLAMSLVRYAWLFIHRRVTDLLRSRRGKRMQINKQWLSGLIAYYLGQAALKYGFTFQNEWADAIAGFIITFVIPLIIAWMNRTKIAKPEQTALQPLPQHVEPDKFIQG